MDFTYKCVYCGREVKREETLSPLSMVAMDGALESDIYEAPVLVNSAELAELLARKDDKGRPYLTLEDYVHYAFNDTNRHYLPGEGEPAETYAESAEEALERYDRSRAKVEALLHPAVEPQEETEEDGGFLFEEEKAAAETRKKNLTEKERRDLYRKIELPGFTLQQKIQLLENFPTDDRFPRGVCRLEYWKNREAGFQFKLDKRDHYDQITAFKQCPHCHKEILHQAYKYRQITIGMVGTANVGKTCLIAAMVDYMTEHSGQITMTQKEYQNFLDKVMTEFRRGYPVDKTYDKDETYHPSVVYNDVLWTFVDMPGETNELGVKGILKDEKFKALLHCDTFLFCVEEDIKSKEQAQSNLPSLTKNMVKNILDALKELKRQPQLVLAVTKVDEAVAKKAPKAEMVPFIPDRYAKEYKKEYNTLIHLGLKDFVDLLEKETYFTPITCAPYGYKTLKVRNELTGEEEVKEHKKRFKEKYMEQYPNVLEENIPYQYDQLPQMRNINLIIGWIERVTGQIGIDLYGEDRDPVNMDLAAIKRDETHWDDRTAMAIATMFCNPSESDKQWYDAMGPGFGNWFRRRRLRSKRK